VHLVLAGDHFGFGAGHWAFDDAALQRYHAQVTGDGGKAVAAAIEAVRPSASNWHARPRGLGVIFTQPPVAMGPVTTAVFADTCGNLIQIAQQH